MGQFVDLAGQRFGRLVVKESAGRDKHGSAIWRCVCDDGNERIISSNNLRRGTARSCGCLQKETAASIGRTNKGKVTQFKHRMTDTPEYTAWQNMMARCYRPTHPRFADWGGRGIKVCDRWRDKANGFTNFLADVGLRPEGKTLDRFPNNDGNYEPGNVAWRTPKEQIDNQRRRQAA